MNPLHSPVGVVHPDVVLGVSQKSDKVRNQFIMPKATDVMFFIEKPFVQVPAEFNGTGSSNKAEHAVSDYPQ